MKNIVSFLVMSILFISSISAQSDTTYINQSSDTIYQQVFISFDEDGREISKQTTYYDSTEFFNFIFDLTFKADQKYFNTEMGAIEAAKNEKKKRKAFNELKGFYEAFIGSSYVNDLDSIQKSQLNGEWCLVVGNVKYQVKLSNNGNKIIDTNSAKKMKINYIQNKKLKITVSNDDSFFDEEVILIKTKDNKGNRIYKGYKGDGTKVILRR